MTGGNGEDRFAGAWRQLRERGELGLIAYQMVGFPDLAMSASLAGACLSGGADALELGVPFSDPIADGPAIQRSSQVALAQGGSIESALSILAALHRRWPDRPLLLMTYLNPVLSYGLESFISASLGAGCAGWIVPDLPVDDQLAVRWRRIARGSGAGLVALVAPTSTPGRLATAARLSQGFLYCVSVVGVTGARRHLDPNLEGWLRTLKPLTRVPRAVGFGISRPQHLRWLRGKAELAVVASALIETVERAGRAPRRGGAAAALESQVRSLKEATLGSARH